MRTWKSERFPYPYASVRTKRLMWIWPIVAIGAIAAFYLAWTYAPRPLEEWPWLVGGLIAFAFLIASEAALPNVYDVLFCAFYRLLAFSDKAEPEFKLAQVMFERRAWGSYFRHLEIAADNGHAEAAFQIASFAEKVSRKISTEDAARGVISMPMEMAKRFSDPNVFLSYYRAAADKNHGRAAYALSKALIDYPPNALGPEEQLKYEASEYYKKAVELHDDEAIDDALDNYVADYRTNNLPPTPPDGEGSFIKNDRQFVKLLIEQIDMNYEGSNSLRRNVVWALRRMLASELNISSWDAKKLVSYLKQEIRSTRLAREEDAYVLGEIYRQGLCFPQDFVQAYAWLSFSASQGYADAASRRDLALEYLSPQQWAAALGQIEGWNKGHFRSLEP